METKECNCCGGNKELSEFYFRTPRNKHDPTCRYCVSGKANKKYNANSTKQKESNKKWKENNLEKFKELSKGHSKKYYQNNKEKVLESNRAWRRENPNWQKKYESKKRLEDIEYRIAGNLRTRMSMAVKHQSAIKENTKELLGCDIPFLRNHLQNTFTDNMSWNNYGEWHIDHIKPCSRFDLTNIEEQNECFHYSNLQALWAEDNIRKGNR